MNRSALGYSFVILVATSAMTLSFQNCSEQPLPDVSNGESEKPPIDEVTPATIDNLSMTAGNVEEGSVRTVTLTLDAAFTTPQTFQFETRERTGANAAEAGVHFTAKSGNVTFAPGQTQKTFTINTIENTIDAANKSFDIAVGIFDTTSSRYGVRISTVSILDDDTTSLTFTSRVFTTAGTGVTTVVPTGANRVVIRAWGGGGGGGGASRNDGPVRGIGGHGGGGGYAQGTFQVMAGDILRVYVGGGGMRGATPVDGGGNGGGGGGATRVEITRAGVTKLLLIAAGGGGGGGAGNDGSDPVFRGTQGGAGGSNTGFSGVNVATRSTTGGRGGSQTAGGLGGTCDYISVKGGDGAVIQGGQGGTHVASPTLGGVNGGGRGGGTYSGGGGGGGGGGGWRGGGGGGCGSTGADTGASGGGGGSNFLNASTYVPASPVSLAGSGRSAAKNEATVFYPTTGTFAYPGYGGIGATTTVDLGSAGRNGRVVISPLE